METRVDTLVINDPHLGVSRQAGTTKESRLALEEYMFKQFERLLNIPHDVLIILGDLCDSRNVPEHVMLRIAEILGQEVCFLVLGNHDIKGVVDHTISSCELIGNMTEAIVISSPRRITPGIYVVPHMFNQDEFDRAIQDVPANVLLLTHCNIDSPFAQSDHSLNLDKNQIKDLESRGVEVLAAHEHTARKYMNNVTVIGNQFPSSISDCLGGDKRCVLLRKDGTMEMIPTWSADSDFVVLDRENIHDPGKKFIRIEGTCSIKEHALAVREINDLRKSSEAFIIANNVKVNVQDNSLSKEEVTNFNILELLMEQVAEEFRDMVKTCL